MNQRLNSLNSDKIDRVTALNRANNGGRPPTSVRPSAHSGGIAAVNTAQGRVSAINFYNQTRPVTTEDQQKPSGLEHYQIGKSIG